MDDPIEYVGLSQKPIKVIIERGAITNVEGAQLIDAMERRGHLQLEEEVRAQLLAMSAANGGLRRNRRRGKRPAC